MHRLQELVRLHRKGTQVRRIALQLRMSPKTEQRYRAILKTEGLLHGPPDALPDLETLKAAVLKHQPAPSLKTHETSSVVEWAEEIQEHMKKGLGPKAIYDRLRTERKDDFQGSYDAVKRFYRQLRKAQGIGPEDVAIPVVTSAGEVAQVDFGYVGQLFDPEQKVLRKAWCFVMVLGFSRHMYVEVVFDQKTETWVDLHVRALEYFGGVVRTIVPDNLKAAVVRRAFGHKGDTELNRSYRELARYYDFQIDPTPPRAPKKKGKVESAVKYVKDNALKGRAGEDVQQVNRFLLRWLEDIAGQRIHGTTRKQPLVVFREEEQTSLLPLPAKPYEKVLWKRAKVQQNSHVEFDGRFYSVPWTLIGNKAWVQATPKSVIVHVDDVRHATHRRRGKGQWSTIEDHLPEHRRDLRYRSQEYWEGRADKIGPETGGLIRETFESDDVLSQLRTVQSIVTHLESFPGQRAENAARRARFYGTYKYAGIKRILKEALDMEPLPGVVVPSTEPHQAPRFARNAQELLQAAREVNHEPH